MRVDPQARAVPAINQFLGQLLKGIEAIEQAGGDTGRIYTYYDVSLHDKKQASAADLSVAIDQAADGKIVTRTYDPLRARSSTRFLGEKYVRSPTSADWPPNRGVEHRNRDSIRLTARIQSGCDGVVKRGKRGESFASASTAIRRIP